MNNAGTIGTNRREEVLGFESLRNILKPFAVASKEYGTRPRSVSNTDNVSLDKFRAVVSALEWLVVSTGSVGKVSDGVLVVACIPTGLGNEYMEGRLCMQGGSTW